MRIAASELGVCRPFNRYEGGGPHRTPPAEPPPPRAARTLIRFYTWGDADCRLAPGTTHATLIDDSRVLDLAVGDVLMLEEVMGPCSGHPADADPSHRHLVRLTRVRHIRDAFDGGRELLAIEWGAIDALPFTLCLSARLPLPDGRRLEHVTIARGIVAAAEQGLSVAAQPARMPDAVRDAPPALACATA
jgi:hypothetical protein